MAKKFILVTATQKMTLAEKLANNIKSTNLAQFLSK